MMNVGQLAAIWRYPVKSLQGEQLAAGLVEHDGLHGDRCWGLRDDVTGKILTGRREPRLLDVSAALSNDGLLTIATPDGAVLRGAGPGTDVALGRWLGRAVSLSAAAGSPGGHAEYFADATDDASAAIEWTMPAGRFVDALPLLVLTTASLRAGSALHPGGDWHARRFRPNLLVDVDDEGWVEDSWCGRTVRIGEVELIPRVPCERCTMVTRPQPGLQRDLDIFKILARHHGSTIGVWTTVQTPGPIRAGDVVEIVEP